LDPDNEGFGLDMFTENIDDPQATNALNTNIIEEIDNLLKVFFFKIEGFFFNL